VTGSGQGPNQSRADETGVAGDVDFSVLFHHLFGGRGAGLTRGSRKPGSHVA
jgi:hypothetical protein